jgi:branched-chain amino acid transport system substrate-binding protein
MFMGSLSVFFEKTEERIAPSIRLRFQSYHYKKNRTASNRKGSPPEGEALRQTQSNKGKRMKIQKILYLFISLFLIFWRSNCPASEIVIGFSGPLTGPAFEYGSDCRNGVEMAIKEINSAGGLNIQGEKYFFRLGVLDDLADPAQAQANARRFRNDKAIAVFNPVFRSMENILKINEEPDNAFLAIGYTLSLKAFSSGNKLLIVQTPPIAAYMKVYRDIALEKIWRKAALVVSTGVSRDEWRDQFRVMWDTIGGQIVSDAEIDYAGKTDYTSTLKEVLATGPQVMLIGGPLAETELFIKQARHLGYKGGFFLTEQSRLDFLKQNPGTLLALGETTGPISFLKTPGAAAFARKYRELYKKAPTEEVVRHYSVMRALARVISAAGSVDDPYAIRSAFPKAFPILGDQFPAESFGISAGGRVQNIAAVERVKNEKLSSTGIYVWWTGSREEFNKVRMIRTIDHPMKRIKVKPAT